MSKKKNIPQPEKNKGKRFTSQDPINYDNKPPIFSLERLKEGKYCFSHLDQKDKAAFAESIFKRRNIPWKNIKNLPRHGLGIEKISKSSIKTALPKNITADFDDFLVFRFSGKKPMVGYRIHDIFYVLWFDHDFTLYNH
jgi:hypothetical protein